MSTQVLEERGLNLASSTQNKKIGTIFLDRTIYHTVELTDSEGRAVLDAAGNPIIENRAFLSAGRYITPDMMEEALQVEREFARLNKLLRDDMEQKGLVWKLPKPTTLSIEGIT